RHSPAGEDGEGRQLACAARRGPGLEAALAVAVDQPILVLHGRRSDAGNPEAVRRAPAGQIGRARAGGTQNLHGQTASQRQPRSRRWRSSCTAGARSTLPRWTSARRGGTAGRARASPTSSQQQAELPDLKAACPDDAEGNAQVLQDVLLRVDRTCYACFRRVKAAETPGSGYPHYQGRGRSNRVTD